MIEKVTILKKIEQSFNMHHEILEKLVAIKIKSPEHAFEITKDLSSNRGALIALRKLYNDINRINNNE